MKRIYYLQRIILSVLLLLPLSGCFDSDINRKMYEADDDEMQRENHIVGATLRVMQGLVSPTREHLYQFMDAMAGGAYGGYMEGIVDTWVMKFSTFNPEQGWLKSPFADPITDLYPQYLKMLSVTDDPVALALGKILRVCAMHRVTDIYMHGMSGMDAAKELRKTDADCLLVFTTTSTDHALEGFQVRALHYLVKPFSEEELSALLAEMLARLPRPEPVLTVKVSGSDVRLCYRDIISAEHFAHLINIRTTALKTLVTRQSFKVLTEPLKKDPRFFVCGRGMIVNLEHAADFRDGAFCMTDGSSVYVSQELLKPARQAFMEFLLQRERIK